MDLFVSQVYNWSILDNALFPPDNLHLSEHLLDFYDNIKNIAPNILMESESHSEAQIDTGRKIMSDLGGRVIVMPYFDDQSSTLIKSKISESNSGQ